MRALWGVRCRGARRCCPAWHGTTLAPIDLRMPAALYCTVLQVTKEKLSGLMADRQKYYENADVVVTLEGYGEDVGKGAPTAVVMYRLLKALNAKVQEKKKEREERMNFTIENADQLKTMRTIQSPAAQVEEQQQQQQ